MRIYRGIKDHFQVGSYTQVPAKRFNELVEFIKHTPEDLTESLPCQDGLKEIYRVIDDSGFYLDKIIAASEAALTFSKELRAKQKAVMGLWPEDIKNMNYYR